MGLLTFIKNINPKYHKELEKLISDVDNNASNNYKDAAQKDFKKFVSRFEELIHHKALNEKQISYYSEMKTRYENELRGFHH